MNDRQKHPLEAKGLKHHDFAKYPHGHPLPSHGGTFTWDGDKLEEVKESAEPTAAKEWQPVEVQDDAAATA